MIRKLSTLVLSLMVSTFVAQAQTPPDNEIWYTTTDGKKAELCTGGDSFEENGWYFEIISHTYNNGLGIIHANKPIKAYGYEEDGDLYYELRLTGNNLKTITFPKCTEYFYDLNFSSCKNLRTIKCRYSSSDGRCLIKNGRLFGFTPGGLTKYTIPNSVTSIGEEVFWGCSSLTSIIIPNSVTEIEDSAFSGFSSLKSITIPNSVTEIGGFAFWNCSSLTSITIPNSVTEIEDGTFRNCSSLTSITIPNSVTSIGKLAFADCSSLTSITISESVTSIGEYAFDGCSSLTNITIPNSVTEIGGYAFWNCSSLTSITIPNSVTSIGEMAFVGCSSLKSFKGKFASEDGRSLIKDGKLIAFAPAGLTSYTIPNSVTSIGDYEFLDCSSLTSINIPNSVTEIGEYAFDGCSSLTSITIPNSVKSIKNWTFAWCSSLTSITIPNSVTSIGYEAFKGCNIQSVIIDTVTGDTSYIEEVFGDNKIAGYRGKYASEDGRCLIVDGKLIDVVEHNLTTYTIPDGVVEIGNKAFANCTGLTSLTIPNSVTTIKSGAFNDCNSIKTLSLNTYGFNADCIYLGNLEELTLGTSVKDVAEGTFAKSSKLKRLTINTEHFSGKWVDLSKIEEITIAPGITILDSNALSGFSGKLIVDSNNITKAMLAGANPTEIVLGDNVQSFEHDALSECSNLTKFSGSNTTEDGCNVVVNGRLIAVIQANLTEYVVPEGVTEIGSHVFKGCTSLTNVNMPESLTAIGKYAFYGCSGLTQITLPEGITKLENGVFANCGLTSIDLPNSITTIGEYTFYECANLASVTIAPGVTSIGACAFKDCSKLKSVTIPNSVTSFGKSAFDGCNIEQITVNAVTGNTFSGCEGLSADKVVAYKGDYASADGRCIIKDGVLINILHKGVVTYTIPSEIKVINRELFKGCTSLAKLFITENVTEIGAEAFKDCNNLKSVIIANSVTTIGKDAFAGCNIEQIVVNAVTGNKIPYGNGLAADKVVAYTGKCASEDGLCLIKHGTLIDYLHRGTTTYAIPEGVKVISSRVFSGCSSLIEVTIPDSVAEIGAQAFKGCSGISKIRIPAGVTWIGDDAFGECSSLTDITCMAIIPPTISYLGISESVTIYVPKEALKEYKTEPNWSIYSKQFKRVK
ncbi:MAG: leucine-rich repeat protein [Alistipes sp.]|nr:leucine-rich repeat protein [Alistipes sp.]